MTNTQTVGRELRRLDAGAAVQVTVEAKRRRNETGLLLVSSENCGELLLMVNDVFYFNNKGVMTIGIKHCQVGLASSSHPAM